MVRAFDWRGLGVYVYDETSRGSRHHLPHAHIVRRGHHVGSVYLYTMEIYDCDERVPRGLRDELAAQQDQLLDMWVELNGED